MKVHKNTQLIALKQRTLNRVAEDASKEIAEALAAQGEEIPIDVIRDGLFEFIILSTRIDPDESTNGLKLAQMNDDAGALAVKYLEFLTGDYSDLTIKAWAAITKKDSNIQTDPTTAPSPPKDVDEKK